MSNLYINDILVKTVNCRSHSVVLLLIILVFFFSHGICFICQQVKWTINVVKMKSINSIIIKTLGFCGFKFFFLCVVI